MALTRKFLSALGIEADKVDEIIEAHAETVNALKAERDDFKGKAEKADSLEKELKETKEQLENNGSDAYKVKYEAIKEEFDGFKAEQEAKAVIETKSKAYRALLKEAGVSEKRIDAVMKVTKLDDVEMDGDKLKDADKLTEAVKAEWSDFIVSENKEGAGTETPPENNGGAPKPIPIPSIF